MDTGGDSTHTGDGVHIPDQVPTPSTDASPKGLPVESSHVEASAGSPVEPLVVIDSDESATLPQRAKLTPNQFAFLQALAAEAGNISAAARRCEQARTNHYLWLGETDGQGNPTPTALAYRQLVESIDNEACDEVDAEIRRRGIKGVKEPVYYQGEICGYVRKFSDLLLIFRAKALMPEKYRERHEVTGANGAPLHPSKVDVNVHVHDRYADALKSLTEEELDLKNAITRKLLARASGPGPSRTN